jgi:6-phosphogluconolactonase
VSLIRRYRDAKSAAEACGAEVLLLLAESLKKQSRATLAISGGTSPKIMFEFFARSEFDWSRVHIFWVDERCVPKEHPDSNYKLAHDAWLKDLPGTNIHRVRTELPPEQAAVRYAEEIEPFLPLDVIHRGMGSDAHTASLFPGDPLVKNLTDSVGVANRAIVRITLLTSVLESARHTVILATGADKAEPLSVILQNPHDPLQYPAQIASMDSKTATWFIDEAAAARL